MKSIQIGAVIASKRKEKGLTQEELAEYLGVSKPAVSKWESEQNYPDITLLPVIASYFDISVDELLDYQPQMTKEDIRKLYKRLSESFISNGFEQTREQCSEYIKKYYSCCPLMFNMGLLLLNNAHSAKNLEKTSEIINDAIELFERVEEISADPSLVRQALHVRAMGYLMLGKPNMVIDLLDDILEIPLSTEVLLASAYQQKGEVSSAIGLLQKCIYKNLITLYAGEPTKIEQWIQSALETVKAFGIAQMHPLSVLPIHINAALLYLGSGNHEKAIEYLESYAEILCLPGIFPLSLKGSELFDKIDGLFESFDLGTTPPRSDEAVKQSLKDVVLNQPAWNALSENEKYQRIVRKIKLI